MTERNLQFCKLHGPDFEDAVQGHRRPDGTIAPPWLAQPRVRYYSPRSALRGLRGEKDGRVLFLALTEPSKDLDSGWTLQRCVGALELDQSPYESDLLWLMYVSVDPEYQRQGVAATLVSMMVQHLASQPVRLQRSTASDEGALKIQAHLDRALNAAGIAWTQNGRESGTA